MDIKSFSPQNFQDWPLPFKVMVFFLIYLMTFYLGYRFHLSEQMKDLNAVMIKEADYKSQIEFVIKKNKSLQDDVSRLPKIKSMLNDWENQLVPYSELPQLLNEILKLGGNNNLYFSTFTPGESEKIEVGAVSGVQEDKGANTTNANSSKKQIVITYYKVPIKVVVAGSYHDIATFMSESANLSKVVSIGDFTISRSTDSSLLGEQLAKHANQQKLLTAELEFDVYHIN